MMIKGKEVELNGLGNNMGVEVDSILDIFWRLFC